MVWVTVRYEKCLNFLRLQLQVYRADDGAWPRHMAEFVRNHYLRSGQYDGVLLDILSESAWMGADPRRSVVGPDHAVHDVRDLYVTDGSSAPSSLAVNPQLTIMAMATRAAERIGRRLERA